MNNLNLFCAVVLFAQVFSITSAYSQISIVSSDYQNKLNVPIKTVGYGSSDTSGLRSVITASGENRTWNLTGRTYTGSETTTSTLLNKSTSGAPQQTNSAFSSANLVVKRQSSSEPWSTSWSYESLTETGLFFHGYVEDSLGIVLANQTNAPKWQSQKFPATYQTSWTWSSGVTSTTYRPSGSVGAKINMTGSDIIDGHGTVKTPEGSFTCLRLKSRTNMLFGFFTITTYSYEFFDQNRTYARISADETGNIPEYVSYYKPATLTGIDITPIISPGNIRLSQNFPNPFSHSTLIEYALPRDEFVTLKVYSKLGNEIALLVNQRKSAGKHSVTFEPNDLPSDVYFYCLQAGQFTETKRLVFLK